MISLNNFEKIVTNMLHINEYTKDLYNRYGLEFYFLTDCFDLALSAFIEEIIPKDKIDYFYKTVYSKSMSENKIEESYNNIFNK